MKRISLFVYTVLISFAVTAQQKVELRLGGDYGLSTSHGNTGTVNGINSSVNASLGRGFGLSGDATWWFNRFIGVTAGASYKATNPPVKTTDFRAIAYDGPGYRSTWHGRVAYAFAGIAVKVPGIKINPYARMGVLLPVYTRVIENTDWSVSNFGGSSDGTFTRGFHTANTPGYKASIGIEPSLCKHVALFAEINLEASKLQVQRSTLNSYTSNGTELINTLSVNVRETVYVKNIPSSIPADPDRPSQAQQFSFPFGSIGMNIGIAIKL